MVTLVIQSIILGRLVRVRVNSPCYLESADSIENTMWSVNEGAEKKTETLGCVIPGLEIPLI